MSAALKTAVVQHALDVAQVYKDNAALTRGLPERMPRLRINDQRDAAVPQGEQPIAAQLVEPAKASWAKPALLAAAMALGSVGLGAGAAKLFSNPKPPQPTIIQQGGDTSLLQYLEDEGFHLPPEKRAVK